MFVVKFLFLISWIIQPALAQQQSLEVPEIVVSGTSENKLRLKKEEINRVEVLKPNEIRKKQAQTFAQALDDEKGIDTQTSCAFCGAKRITINGLKGEHTSVLVDGLPLHSTVSGFYGIEAIPLEGIDSIEIYRGAGAALTVPEAIGGAINIVTKEIVTDSVETNLSFSDRGQKNFSVLGTKKINEKSGFLMGLQHGEILPLDLDHNGVSEIPRQNNQSIISKFTHKINAKEEISLRASYATLKTIGGTMNKVKLTSAVPQTAVSDDFQDRDVRKKYLADEKKITDNVDLTRFEAASIYRKQIDGDSSLKISLGGAWQKQNAIYSHGYDYNNKDFLWVGLLEYQRSLNASHLLTIGFDSKNQHMNSQSESLYVIRQPPLNQDDLSYRSLGGFIQDTWFINDTNELSTVLRYDHITTRWHDLDRQLERSVIAPRLFYKHLHNKVLTSRLAAGIGYRAPLTLFESQHGTNHNGFIIDINELETAQSASYSLSGQRQDDFFEIGAYVTRIENMAYGVDRVSTDQSILFKNSDEPYTVSIFDLSYGRRITNYWSIEGLAEFFEYPSGYKSKLPIAAIEERLSINSKIQWHKWKASQKIIFIGARDLTAYGYGQHYNVAPSEDPLDPSFGQPGTDQKWQKAPAFFTLDLTLDRELAKNISLSFSVLNVFNYTQTGAGDSPTTWDRHGNHYHLDNFHIWGPLRGRQFFVSLRGDF